MRKVLVILVLVGLLLRLGWVFSLGSGEAGLSALPDQVEYLALGRSLGRGEGLSFVDSRFGVPVYAYRTPGYAGVVAAVGVGGGSVVGVRVVQAVVDASTILGVFFLARRVSHKYALLPCVFVALCPFQIYFSGLILTETVFTAMLVWGMVLLVSERRGALWVGLGVLALSVLVRPGAVGLPVCLGVVAGMARSRYSGWPVGMVAAGMVGLVLLPWGWRNERVLGEWVFTSTNAGFTAYDGFNAGGDGSSNQGFVKAMPELGEMTETQRNHYLLSAAAEYRAANPGRVWELAGLKVARTWSPVPLSEGNQSAVKIAAALVYTVPAWVLVLAGLLKGSGRVGMKVLLVTPAVYFTVGAAMSVGSLRYRVPAEPVLAALTGAGAAAVLGGRRLDKPRP